MKGTLHLCTPYTYIYTGFNKAQKALQPFTEALKAMLNIDIISSTSLYWAFISIVIFSSRSQMKLHKSVILLAQQIGKKVRKCHSGKRSASGIGEL